MKTINQSELEKQWRILHFGNRDGDLDYFFKYNPKNGDIFSIVGNCPMSNRQYRIKDLYCETFFAELIPIEQKVQDTIESLVYDDYEEDYNANC